MTSYSGPERIDAPHQTQKFDCGEEPLNEYLRRYALANDRSDAAKTFVLHTKDRVVAYYTLVLGAVLPAEAPARIVRGLGAYPIGVMILARLAVATSEQGQGLGAALLKDAMIRSARVAEEAGTRAFVVHAKHQEARSFYERYGFEPSPTDAFQLFLLMKDIRRWLRDAGYSLR